MTDKQDNLTNQRPPSFVQLAVTSVVVLLVGAILVYTMTKPMQFDGSQIALGSKGNNSAPAVTPTATINPSLYPVGLAMKGHQFVTTTTGAPVKLVGVVRSSLEYECHGDNHYTLSDFQAIRAWGANTVRITLSSAFWANLNNVCPDYHLTVTTATDNALSAGLYVVLTLQDNAPTGVTPLDNPGGAQCSLPVAQDLQMWQDLGSIYQDNSAVLFDIYSEPHDVTLQQWYNGGPIKNDDCNKKFTPGISYTGLGMFDFAKQIRLAAPSTILIIAGRDYGYNLLGVGTLGYTFNIPNIIFSTHPFDHKTVQQPADWPYAFGTIAKTLPVMATEMGAYDCQTLYVSDEIKYFASLNMSWIAWGWAPLTCATPSLISDWSGTPFGVYGQTIQSFMRAITATQTP